MHDGFIIDIWDNNRGHRLTILNDALKEVGIGSASGSATYNGTFYPYFWTLTCDFGARTTVNSFLLGVVYNDTNKDGRYTAGEGTGGVGIAARRLSDGQTTTTTTASAGGYGLSLPAGQYQVTATLADGRKRTKSLTLADKNVKIDFTAAEFGQPGGGDTPTGQTGSSLPPMYYLLLEND